MISIKKMLKLLCWRWPTIVSNVRRNEAQMDQLTNELGIKMELSVNLSVKTMNNEKNNAHAIERNGRTSLIVSMVDASFVFRGSFGRLRVRQKTKSNFSRSGKRFRFYGIDEYADACCLTTGAAQQLGTKKKTTTTTTTKWKNKCQKWLRIRVFRKQSVRRAKKKEEK